MSVSSLNALPISAAVNQPEATSLTVSTVSHYPTKDISRPLEIAYSGTVSPGKPVTVHIFYKNTSNKVWEGVVLRGKLQGLKYCANTTVLNDKYLEDKDDTSPLLAYSGTALPSLKPQESGVFSINVEVSGDFKELQRENLQRENFQAEGLFTLERQGSILAKAQGVAFIHAQPEFSKAHCELTADASESVRPSQIVNYSILAVNSGEARASGVFVRIRELTHAQYVPGSTMLGPDFFLDHAEGGLLFSPEGLYVGSLAPGKKTKINFKVQVDYPLDSDKAVFAAAEIYSDQGEPVSLEPIGFPVVSSPRFYPDEGCFMSSSAESTVNPEELISYTLHYRNSGDCDAYETGIRIESSPYLELVPGSVVCDQGDFPYEYDLLAKGVGLGTLRAGEHGKLSFQMKVRSPVDSGGKITVQGFILPSNGPEVSLEPIQSVVHAKPFFADPNSTWMEVSPRGMVEPDTLLSYVFHFKNIGGARNVQNCTVWCTLPQELSLIRESLLLNDKKIFKNDDIASLFSSKGLKIENVMHGLDNQITFQARVISFDNETSLDVSAGIMADGAEPYVTPPVTSVVHGKPDFSRSDENYVEVSPQKEVSPGEIVTYYVHFKNRGPVHAKHVVLLGQELTNTRTIPNKTKLNGIPLPDDEKNSPLFSTQGLRVGPLNIGESGTVAFQVKVNAPLEKGSVIGGQIQIVADDLASYLLTLPPLQVRSFPDFSQADTNFLEVFPDTPIPPGQRVTYVLYYKNVGSDDAKNVLLKANSPAGAVYIPGSTRLNGIPLPDVNGTCPLFGPGLTIDQVKWNRSGNVSFQVKVNESVATGTLLENNATIQWQGNTVRTNLTSNPIVSYVTFSNPSENQLMVTPQGELFPGALITYSVRFKNEGTIPAGSAVLLLHTSPLVQYLPNSTLVNGQPVIDLHGASPVLGKEGLALGDIQPGQSGEVNLRCMVAEPLDDGTEIACSARLSWGGNQEIQFNSVKNVVRSSPLFQDPQFNFIEWVPLSAKSDSISTGVDGIVTYVVNFKNTGSSHAHNVAFRGSLPEGWTYVEKSLRLNGRKPDDESSGRTLFGGGLFVKKIETDEEGNFSFQVRTRSFEELSEFPKLIVEAQHMSPQEIFPKPCDP